MLACTVGYFVVWGVTPALHTPLMAVTNAISGIVVVAAIAVLGGGGTANLCFALDCPNPAAAGSMHTVAKVLGFVAVALCAVNIFGGFAITRRMLGMFKRKGQ